MLLSTAKAIENKTLLITFRGDIDMFETKPLRILYLEPLTETITIPCNISYDELIKVVTINYDIVKLDLEHVKYLDSSGLALIINIIKKLRSLNKTIGITKISDSALKLFKLINVEQFILFPS